jgi:uncharacterized protein (TIGR02594 family)
MRMTTRTRVPRHVLVALGELGVKEWPDGLHPIHNPRILEYHAATTLHSAAALTDEAAYCGSFMAWVWKKVGLEPPEKAFRARSWLKAGVATEFPELGDVCVVKRIKRGSDKRTGSRGGWHVGQWVNRTRGGIILLSANVGDRVGVDFFSSRRWDVKALRRTG